MCGCAHGCRAEHGESDVIDDPRVLVTSTFQRTRSLLAQLEDGVVEQYVRRRALDDAGELGATVFGIGGKGTWGTHESQEESRSLMDLTAVVFEEAATSQGLIVDIEPSDRVEDWASGEVHQTLREGEILRISGDFLITDPDYIGARFATLEGFVADLIEMQVGIAMDALRLMRDAELDDLQGKMRSANSNQRKQFGTQIAVPRGDHGGRGPSEGRSRDRRQDC